MIINVDADFRELQEGLDNEIEDLITQQGVPPNPNLAFKFGAQYAFKHLCKTLQDQRISLKLVFD